MLMDCSASLQNYKNYGDQQVFVSRVQPELINSIYTPRKIFPELA
jgi:hypothetical protein